MIHRRRSLYDFKRTFAGRLESEWRSIFRLLRVRLILSGLFLNAFWMTSWTPFVQRREFVNASTKPASATHQAGSQVMSHSTHSAFECKRDFQT